MASPVVTASSTLPSWSRFLLLNMEPLFALNGILLSLISPSTYTAVMTRGVLSTINYTSYQWIFTELAGGWLHFAFTEAVVLRMVDDLRVWRLLCIGMLLSDLLYCHSCAEAVGGWGTWLKVWDWTVEDWGRKYKAVSVARASQRSVSGRSGCRMCVASGNIAPENQNDILVHHHHQQYQPSPGHAFPILQEPPSFLADAAPPFHPCSPSAEVPCEPEAHDPWQYREGSCNNPVSPLANLYVRDRFYLNQVVCLQFADVPVHLAKPIESKFEFAG
ncbi:hypothetical protein MKZ38_009929 [Zalerion maritima]|uniref:DUF7704 domain-containing protein n=1 Tax=Zalerion maritima TaxID=339359 RepID=A0AAD5RSV9_9PEZI|nr:hypothetical protein MKZ38_009929 [Zalerion maritima]